jgi:hypothetical protein
MNEVAYHADDVLIVEVERAGVRQNREVLTNMEWTVIK